MGTVTRLLPTEELRRLDRPGKPPILMNTDGVAYLPVFVAVLERGTTSPQWFISPPIER
jgi:hypothetical protein